MSTNTRVKYLNFPVADWTTLHPEYDSSPDRNKEKWNLSCSVSGFSPSNQITFVPLTSPFTSISNTVAVFLDTPACILSFYWLNSSMLLLIHTFSDGFASHYS